MNFDQTMNTGRLDCARRKDSTAVAALKQTAFNYASDYNNTYL
jgi:hypothetical protein